MLLSTSLTSKKNVDLFISNVLKDETFDVLYHKSNSDQKIRLAAVCRKVEIVEERCLRS